MNVLLVKRREKIPYPRPQGRCSSDVTYEREIPNGPFDIDKVIILKLLQEEVSLESNQ